MLRYSGFQWQVLTALCLLLCAALGTVNADVPDYTIDGDDITSWTCSSQAKAASDNLLQNPGFDDGNFMYDDEYQRVEHWYIPQNGDGSFNYNQQTAFYGSDETPITYYVTDDQTKVIYSMNSYTDETYNPLHYDEATPIQSTPRNRYTLSFFYGKRETGTGTAARIQVVWNGQVVATADLTKAPDGGSSPTALIQYCVPVLLEGTGADSLVIYAFASQG